MSTGEKQRLLQTSQQQRYVMTHHHQASKKEGGRAVANHRGGGEAVKVWEQQNRKTISSVTNKGNMFLQKRKRPSFRVRGGSGYRKSNKRRQPYLALPKCRPSTGCVNITNTYATLGRTAAMKCVAKNLVGQKTVGTCMIN